MPEAADLDRAYGLEVVDYIVKPVSGPALRAKAKVFLELYRSRTELAQRVAERTTDLEKELLARARTETVLRGATGTRWLSEGSRRAWADDVDTSITERTRR